MNFFKISVLLFLFSFLANRTNDLLNHFSKDENTKISLEKETSEDESSENEDDEKEEFIFAFSYLTNRIKMSNCINSNVQMVYFAVIHKTIHFPFESPYSPPEIV